MRLCSTYLRELGPKKTLTSTLSMLSTSKKDYKQAYKKLNGLELTIDEIKQKYENERKNN